MIQTLFSGALVFDGTSFLPASRDVLIRDGEISSVSHRIDAPETHRITGGVLFPGFVDAHVHLPFARAKEVARGGVTTVLDLGSPEEFAFSDHPPLTVFCAGPLLTAPRGYPTRSWGAAGFGLELHDAPEAKEAVARLAGRGAAIVKVAIEPAGGAILDADVLSAAVDEAHAHGLPVAAHALGAASVATALDAGVDVLAHMPVEPLPVPLIRAIASRGITVVSTIRAFGAARSTLGNLAALSAAGVTIAYGTDLGNDGIMPGIDVDELELLAEAFESEEHALAAATSVAGAYAGGAGKIEPGAPADLVWLPSYTSLADLRGEKSVWKSGTLLAQE